MRNNILILGFTLTILFSCRNKDESHLEHRIMEVAVADESISQIKMPPPVVVKDEASSSVLEIKPELLESKSSREKKIIKDGNITIKADDIETSKKNIDNSLKKWNAYYEGEDLQNNDQSIAYHLKIRIPSVNFEKLISSLENGKDEIKSKNILTRDVTEEYVDIESRLSNKRDYLNRYKALLSKAATVKDILAIEENIRTLQEEIESQQGRLNYLKDQVSFSTLNITLFKEKEYIEQPKNGFFTRTKIAVNQGWQSIVDFALWILGIWPYLIILFGAYFIMKRIIKIRKNRN